MRRYWYQVTLIAFLLSCPTPSFGQAWSGILAPERAIDWSNVGIPGGIPSGAWANCTTSACNTLYGGTVTSTSIRSALSSAPNNTVVRIPAGTYSISGNVYSNRSNVVLRGAGPTQTILNMGGGSLLFGLGTGGQGNVPGGNWSDCSGTCATKTLSTYAKGSTSLTLSSTSGLSAGMVIVIDERNASYIQLTGSEGSEDAGRAESPLSFHGTNVRAQPEMARIASVDDSTHITIDPPGLGHTFSSSLSPQIMYWSASQQVNYNGVENLRVISSGDYSVSFPFCNFCWTKNIAVTTPSGSVKGSIYFYWSFRGEVRDSYVAQSNAAGAPTEYGIEFDSSPLSKIENNIIFGTTTPTQVETSFGTVIGYNYILNTSSGNQFPALDFHRAHSHQVLAEGNVASNITMDFVWGSASHNTAFRNRFSGYDPNKTNYYAAAKVNAWNRYVNLVGNVLGTPSVQTAYECSPSHGLNSDNLAIYELALQISCGWGTSGSDATTYSSLLRWGNWDSVTYAASGNTHGTRWCTGSGTGSAGADARNASCTASETANADPTFPGLTSPGTTLPNSLYLSAKPSWWGSVAWPAIGPDVTGGNIANTGGHANKIPAQLCYENTAKSNGFLTAFDASACYYSGATVPSPAPPTNVVVVP